MVERPILFSGPMVAALLAGRKTQTRRAFRDQPPPGVRVGFVPGRSITPYGAVGDHLWVRETFFAFGRWETRFSEKKGRDEWHFIDMTLDCGKAYVHAASGAPHDFAKSKQRGGVTPAWWKRPAIFMPRAASRITLEITEVRVERLQSISEADALAEGVEALPMETRRGTPRADYCALWESINGAGSWDANPWLWCVSFRPLAPTT